jgi:hypothetical protein
VKAKKTEADQDQGQDQAAVILIGSSRLLLDWVRWLLLVQLL